jgi:predicted O-methyltransferase YrrM
VTSRNPTRWIAIPTAMTDVEAALASLAAGGVVLEVGALLGYSTVVLASRAEFVLSIDPHDGYPDGDPRPTLAPFLENLARYGVRDKVAVIVEPAEKALPFLASEYFDLVFVDVTGRYEDTIAVMEGTMPLLRTGGVLAVHDCGHPEWPGVNRAVKEFDRLAIFDHLKGG